MSYTDYKLKGCTRFTRLCNAQRCLQKEVKRIGKFNMQVNDVFVYNIKQRNWFWSFSFFNCLMVFIELLQPWYIFENSLPPFFLFFLVFSIFFFSHHSDSLSFNLLQILIINIYFYINCNTYIDYFNSCQACLTTTLRQK